MQLADVLKEQNTKHNNTGLYKTANDLQRVCDKFVGVIMPPSDFPKNRPTGVQGEDIEVRAHGSPIALSNAFRIV